MAEAFLPTRKIGQFHKTLEGYHRKIAIYNYTTAVAAYYKLLYELTIE
jgi:hypothetical protein